MNRLVVRLKVPTKMETPEELLKAVQGLAEGRPEHDFEIKRSQPLHYVRRQLQIVLGRKKQIRNIAAPKSAELLFGFFNEFRQIGSIAFLSLSSLSAFILHATFSLLSSLDRAMKSVTLSALASDMAMLRIPDRSLSCGRLFGLIQRLPSLNKNWHSCLYTWNPWSRLSTRCGTKLVVSKRDIDYAKNKTKHGYTSLTINTYNL